MIVPKVMYKFWKQSFSWAFLLYKARFLKIFSFLKMQNIEHRRMKKFLVIRVTWISKARLYKYFFSSELLNKIFLEDTKLSFSTFFCIFSNFAFFVNWDDWPITAFWRSRVEKFWNATFSAAVRMKHESIIKNHEKTLTFILSKIYNKKFNRTFL